MPNILSHWFSLYLKEPCQKKASVLKKMCIFAPEIDASFRRDAMKSICIGPLTKVRQLQNTRTVILVPFAFAILLSLHIWGHRIRFKVGFTCVRRLAMPG